MACGLAVALMAAPVALAGSVNLVVNHNVIPASATGPAGGDFSYAPLVSLNGGAAATNVKLTEVLPEGVRLNSITFEPAASGACATPTMPFMVTGANKTIACDLNDITQSGSGNGIRVLFNVTIPEVNTNWQALASATATDADVMLGSNADLPRNVTTTTAADLGIQLLGPADPVKQFTPFNYTIKVANNGPSNIPAGGAVVVRFIVPPNSTAGGASGSGWSCSPNGGAAGTEMVCSHAGPLARAQAVSSDLIIPVTPMASGDLDAAATVAGKDVGNVDFPDAVLGNNTATVKVNVEPDNVVNVGVAKGASPATIDAANAVNQVTYTITPKHVSGADVPSNVRIQDPLSGRITSYMFTTTMGWDCSASTATKIDCSFTGTNPGVGGNYPPVVFKAAVNGTGGGTVENTVGVGASNEDPNAGFDNQATAVVQVSNKVNLALTKSANKSPIKAGEAFNWTLMVRNQGPLPVTSPQEIVVVDNVPAGIEITGVSNASGSSGWSCTPTTATGPATITCRNSSGLAANTSSGIVLDAKGVFGGSGTYTSITNNASITGVTGRDPFQPITGSASVNVSQNQVDIGIQKAASSSAVESGQEVTYTLTVTNHDSANPSTGIVVTDALNNLVTSRMGCTFNADGGCQSDGPWPGGGYVSASFTSGSGTCSVNGNKDSVSRTVTCNIPQLAAQSSAVIEIKARHYAPNTDGSNNAIVNNNTATVRSTQVENTNPDNDRSTVPVSVTPITDLQVFKTPTPSPAAVGEPVTYTVHVYNAGPSHAAAVNLKDQLPANAHWIASGFQPSSAICNAPPLADDATGQKLECNWSAPLAPNGQYAITYQLRSSPDAKAEDKLNNTVDVDTSTKEITKQNNQAKAEVILKPAELDVVINMEHTDDALVLGEGTIYTITVTNTGPSYATQVKMTDLFPSTLEIGGQQYPSSATFSYNGITALGTKIGNGASKDLMASVATLCAQPADGAETTSPLQLACTFDKLAPNETVTIKFKMTATQLPQGRNTGTIFHDAKVELHEHEYLSNGSDTAFNNVTSDRTSARRTEDTPPPEVADLGLTKEADSEVGKNSPTLKAGDALVYTLTVTNHGPEKSTAGQVRDTLPKELDYVASPGCDFNQDTRLIACEVGPLDKGEVKVFTIDTTVAKPYTGGPLVENEAEVFSDGDPNPSNNKGGTKTKVFKPVESIPTMGEWSLMLLMAALAGLGATRLRRRS